MTRFLTIAVAALLFTGCGSDAPTSEPAVPASPESGGDESGSDKKEDAGSGTTEVQFNTGNLPTLAVHVPGIHCESCAANVDKTLAGVAGVKDVKICVTSKTATLAIDQAAFDTDAAVKALADAEFEGAEVVTKSDEPAAEGEASSEAS